jgi:hypothetical protein
MCPRQNGRDVISCWDAIHYENVPCGKGRPKYTYGSRMACRRELVKFALSISVLYMNSPSSLQLLQSFGGAVGQSEARWPCCSQRRQVPVNSRATVGFVHSALV